LNIMNLSPSDSYHPNLAGGVGLATGEEAANSAASGAPDPHAFLVRYARVYDTARVEGAGVAEAMEFVEAELLRDLEQSRRQVA
jgi:hypothetical protein